jgi:hypothetical protein
MKRFKIAILSIYQTVQKSHHGLTSIHSQQVAMLATECIKVTLRQTLTTDLIELINKLRQDNLEILIRGDFNDMTHLLLFEDNYKITVTSID